MIRGRPSAAARAASFMATHETALMRANYTVGQAAIALLESYGVNTVFGIPGVHTLEFYRGLGHSRIRHVAPRHEQGAGFMADGYARASGRPGVCVLITGPGVTNAATPIGQAFSDSVPMLVLSSVNATPDLGKGRGRLHEITSQQATMAPLTAFSRTVRDADDLSAGFADAFRVFSAARPRPVHLEVPLDVLRAPAPPPGGPMPTPSRPEPDPAAVAAAGELARRARRPVIIAGGGAVDHGASIATLADHIGAAVVVTTAAKGGVPDSHTRCLGATLSLEPTQALLRSADLVVAVGSELAETDSWIDRLPITGELIRIDIDPRCLARDYPARVAMLADAGMAVRALVAHLESWRSDGVDLSEIARIKETNRTSHEARQRRHVRVLDALRAVLPADGIVASDMTQIAYTANYHFPCERPRCWLHPIGYGTLGYALPAAIGAKLASPQRATVALAGDAGFLFTVQELATAAELKLPIAILLWNNDALGQIADDMVARGIPEIGVKPRNPDFVALARAFQCHAMRPRSLTALRRALSAAFDADRPTLIEVREDAPYLS
jgi:thiamine pyrophosphate-dependent acetolactate synthase large subunit-like protein